MDLHVPPRVHASCGRLAASTMFDVLFGWAADAWRQKETRGCLTEFMFISAGFALIALLAWLAHRFC
jgi:hypothetical protein